MPKSIKATLWFLAIALLVSIVTGVSMPTTVAHADSGDRAALVALYNATGGVNWVYNDKWLSDEPLGRWHGVGTDDNGRVTRLSLDSNQLSGEIPAELGSLANLTYLSLDSNQLSGEIPAELGNLANLLSLFLHENQLSGEIPAELGSLANLVLLSLYENQLSGEIPAELGNLTSLTSLVIHSNQLSGEIPAELGSLANLVSLGLGGNYLTGPIPAELGNLANLEWLALGANQLTGEIPAWLGGLTNLRVLGLNFNQLSGEIPAELGNLANLERLWVSDNQLSGEIPAELGNLANLERLRLSDNQLTGEIPAELGGLTNLADLELSGNQLTGCIPAGLRGVADNDFTLLDLPFCPGGVQSPTINAVTAGARSLTVSWSAPSGDASGITAYDLRYIRTDADETADANWTVEEDVWTTGSGSLQYTLTGLTGGTQYDVQVGAVNAAGDGPWSATVAAATAPVAPGAPAGLTAAVADGKAQVDLSWTAPANTGGAPITGYKIESSNDGSDPWTEVFTTANDSTTYTDDGTDANGPMFSAGNWPHYRVAAVNRVGTGPFSEPRPAGDSLVARYDTNGNDMIDRSEVIAAINDYLFGEGEPITRAEVIKLINLYLFG